MLHLGRNLTLKCQRVAGNGGSLLFATRAMGDQAGKSGDENPAKPIDEDDPAELLKQLKIEAEAKAAQLKNVPPAPPRKSGKTVFFEANSEVPSASTQNAENRQGGSAKRNSDVPSPLKRDVRKDEGGGQRKSQNAFLRELSKMDEETRSTSFPTYSAAAEARRKNIDQKIKEERQKMLVFRDVGMDLDKPILSRDVLLVFKYFRYGIEFAVDNELERMLRYFNEHAVNELKIIQNSKLMRGPAHLSRKNNVGRRASSAPSTMSQASAAGNRKASEQAASFQIASNFPSVRCTPLQQLCAPFDETTQRQLNSVTHPVPPSQSAFSTYFYALSKSSTGKKFNKYDEELFTTLSPASFRRPAVIIFTQLGQKFGAQADAEWRHLAYKSISPEVFAHLPPLDVQGEGRVKEDSPAVHYQGGLRKPVNAQKVTSHNSPVDVVSLRSTDLYKYAWVHKLYINRYAQSLANGQDEKQRFSNALAASSTFVGTRLLEPFYSVLGVRNYLLPHVMLVDHEGTIRWLSGGCPDEYEKNNFPALIKQLEAEYYKSKTTSGPK